MFVKTTQLLSLAQKHSCTVRLLHTTRASEIQQPDGSSSKLARYTLGEAVLGVLELILIVATIILCILFPQPFMLIVLAGFGFALVGLAVWSDSIQNRS